MYRRSMKGLNDYFQTYSNIFYHNQFIIILFSLKFDIVLFSYLIRISDCISKRGKNKKETRSKTESLNNLISAVNVFIVPVCIRQKRRILYKLANPFHSSNPFQNLNEWKSEGSVMHDTFCLARIIFSSSLATSLNIIF